MRLSSLITEHGLGLCRKPPVIHATRAEFVSLPDPAHEGLPDGGSGGAGVIRRGIGSALAGMRTLNRNRQLLWFALLAGLVLAGNTVCQAALWYIEYNLHVPLDILMGRFFIEIATMSCLVFLLAGLFLSLPSKNREPVSFFEGISRAKRYNKALIIWSLVLTLAGMLFVIVFSYVPAWYPTPEILFIYHQGFGNLDAFLFNTLSQFPFNLSRLPPADLFSEIPGYGGRSVLLWFYPGFREALIFSAINLLLFVLTPFVVPLVVLGQKTLRVAVAGSFAMMRKAGAEAAVCAIFLGVIVSGVFLAYLLVQSVHLMATPIATYYRPTDAWIAIALLYDLALFSIAFVAATVAGIAAMDIYTSAQGRQATGFPEP